MVPSALRACLLALVVGVCLALAPATVDAKGRAKVTWGLIDVPASAPSAAWLQKSLKPLLTKASKKADFGKRNDIELRAQLTEWSSVTTGDVHRVNCTIVGRLVGGPRAKSRISFGGSPKDKAKLDKQVLEMVANGVVARLAAIAREEERRQAAKK